jgi:hypothetical protein
MSWCYPLLLLWREDLEDGMWRVTHTPHKCPLPPVWGFGFDVKKQFLNESILKRLEEIQAMLPEWVVVKDPILSVDQLIKKCRFRMWVWKIKSHREGFLRTLSQMSLIAKMEKKLWKAKEISKHLDLHSSNKWIQWQSSMSGTSIISELKNENKKKDEQNHSTDRWSFQY